MEIVLTFETTNFAIKAEQALQKGEIQPGVLPLPASIQAGCGLCLRIQPSQWENARKLLEEAEIPVQGVYSRQMENGKSVYSSLDLR